MRFRRLPRPWDLVVGLAAGTTAIVLYLAFRALGSGLDSSRPLPLSVSATSPSTQVFVQPGALPGTLNAEGPSAPDGETAGQAGTRGGLLPLVTSSAVGVSIVLPTGTTGEASAFETRKKPAKPTPPSAPPATPAPAPQEPEPQVPEPTSPAPSGPPEAAPSDSPPSPPLPAPQPEATPPAEPQQEEPAPADDDLRLIASRVREKIRAHLDKLHEKLHDAPGVQPPVIQQPELPDVPVIDDSVVPVIDVPELDLGDVVSVPDISVPAIQIGGLG
jgi:hypothetical protein